MTARPLQWTGSGDGETWNQLANWKDLDTGAAPTGAAPSTGDSAFVDEEVNIILGLASGAVDLVDLTFGTGATGNLGSSGSSLAIGVTGKLTYLGRMTTCNITAGASGIAMALVGGNGQLTLSGGVTASAKVGPGGNLKIEAAAEVQDAVNGGGTIKADAGTAFGSVRSDSGSTTSARDIDDLRASGNTLVRTTGSAEITAGVVTSGARLNHQSGGDIGEITVGYQGSADAAGSVLPFAITTLNVDPGAKTAFDNEAADIDITNDNDHRLLYSGSGIGTVGTG